MVNGYFGLFLYYLTFSIFFPLKLNGSQGNPIHELSRSSKSYNVLLATW